MAAATRLRLSAKNISRALSSASRTRADPERLAILRKWQGGSIGQQQLPFWPSHHNSFSLLGMQTAIRRPFEGGRSSFRLALRFVALIK